MIGIGDAFIFPVFLQTVSSSILQDLYTYKTDPENPFVPLVFTSYCVLGAISARRLIESLMDKVFELAKKAHDTAVKADQRAAAAEKDVGKVKEKQEAIDVTVTATTDAMRYGLAPSGPKQVSHDVSPLPPEAAEISTNELEELLKSEAPWKSKFGGSSRETYCELIAHITLLDNMPGWCATKLNVRSTDLNRQLTASVNFFLHPRFKNYKPTVPVVKAKLRLLFFPGEHSLGRLRKMARG